MKNLSRIPAALVPILLIGFVPVKAANILVLMLVGSNSHRIQFQPLFETLANRGHLLTVLSHTPYPSHPNITEISCAKPSDFLKDTLTNKIIPKRIEGVIHKDTLPFINLIISTCDTFMKNPKVIDLIENSKFDLIFQDAYGNECGAGLLQHFKAPYILLHPIPPISAFRPIYGLPLQPTVYPISFSRRPYDMTYFERLMNFCETIITQLGLKYYYFYKMEEYYRTYFPDSSGVEEILSNASLIFTSEHPSFDFPKLSTPQIIETGGLHCRPAKELPENLRLFADESGDDGFIYFSMGSLFSSSLFPKELIQVFVKVFSRLKQKVIWKHDNPVEALSSNVKLLKWVPQQDVLGHPNIRLMLTQGGMASMQEAVYHGVPVIGLPVIMDQDEVVARAQQHEIGIIIDLKDLNEEKLYNSIQQVLDEPRFRENAKLLSFRFKDRPLSPLDTAVYWTEYVLRHNGASFLKPSWSNYSAFKYYGIDVISSLLVTLALVSYVIYKGCIFIFASMVRLNFLKIHRKSKPE